MQEQKAAQLTGLGHAFTDAQQKGFEVGPFGMSWASTRRALGLPRLDEGPIEECKEGAILLNQGIMIEQSGDDGLVKEARGGYHSNRLL